MKELYRVFNKKGVTLCFQKASSPHEASYIAANFYGHKGVAGCELVTE